MKNHPDGYFYNLIPNLPVTSYQTTRLCSLNSLKTLNSIQSIQSMHQIHSDIFYEVSQKFSFEPVADSLFTTKSNLTLSVKTADCLPIIFFHPYPLIGAIHAGRKGSDNFITEKTINYLKTTFNLNDEFTFWLGPCISADNYEIDRELHTTYDLLATNCQQITNSAPNSRIIKSNLCTYRHNDLFHSYRKNNQTSLRQHTLIQLLKF